MRGIVRKRLRIRKRNRPARWGFIHQRAARIARLYANGRPLHSGPFWLRDKKSRPPRAPFSPLCPALSPRLAGFGFPLKDYAAKPARLGSPIEAPLMNF